MKRSVSSQDSPPDPYFTTQPQATGNVPNKRYEEQDPVSKEKAIFHGLLQRYCASATGFRIVADEHQPEIFHRNHEGTQVRVPDSHIELTHIEKENTVDAEGKGKIHALHLYVHDDPSKALVSKFTNILREKDEAGELATPNAAFAILQVGMEIMFFEYNTRHGPGEIELRSLAARPRGP